MGPRLVILVVAVALLLAGCSGGHTVAAVPHAAQRKTKQAKKTAPPPETPKATSALHGGCRCAVRPDAEHQGLLSGPAHTIRHQPLASGYLPTYAAGAGVAVVSIPQ